MTRHVFRLSMIISLATSLVCMESAHAQKDAISPQNWGGAPQAGPNYVRRPGPAGALPGWGRQTDTPSGQRPGTVWSQQPGANGAQQPGSGWAQQQSQNWAEQQARNAEMTRQALQAQANQAPRPQVVQYERWKQEWQQQHPGEPIPNMPELERIHHDEIIGNIKRDGADMWARRRQEVQARYQMARQLQEKKNAMQHVTWTQQQWGQWDRQYDQEQRQNAEDYVKNFGKMGDDARLEEANRRYRQSLGLDH